MSEQPNDFEQAVLAVIRDNLRIETEWEGWEYDGISNTLTLRLFLGDHEIGTSRVHIEPVKYDD